MVRDLNKEFNLSGSPADPATVVLDPIGDDEVVNLEHEVVAGRLLKDGLVHLDARSLAFHHRDRSPVTRMHHDVRPFRQLVQHQGAFNCDQRRRAAAIMHQVVDEVLAHPFLGRQCHPPTPDRVEDANPIGILFKFDTVIGQRQFRWSPIAHPAKVRTKEDIVSNWLPRYTGLQLEAFKKHILLTNFDNYIDIFCEQTGATVPVEGKAMRVAVAEDMAMINFGMGSPNAATLMDLLSAVKPETVLFLGKCGGLKKKNALGDLVLPIAAIRGEGTSNDYFPPELPALPSFMIHRAVSHVIRDMELDYWSGTVYTTNRRVWEHDDKFKEHLRVLRCMAIDMETATLFMTGFANEIPTGALLLVSDQPMVPWGVKTSASDTKVTNNFVETHVRVGIASLREIINGGMSVKHLRFE